MGNSNSEGNAFKVLLISDDREQRETYPSKAPRGVSIVCSTSESMEVRKALYEHLPNAVFILFKKGERVSRKSFVGIISYVENNMILLGAMGSRLQLEAFGRCADGMQFSAVSTPRRLREEIEKLSAAHRKSLEAFKKRRSDKQSGKPPLIAAIYPDTDTAALYERVLTAYSLVNGRDFRVVYLDMGIGVCDYLRSRMLIPDLFIFSAGAGSASRDTINSVYSAAEYSPVPYILTTAGGTIKPGKAPAAVIDIKTEAYSLAAKADELLGGNRSASAVT